MLSAMSSLTNCLTSRLLLCLLSAGSVLCWAAAPAVHAAPVNSTLTITTNYYFAYGATAVELNQSLLQARPWRTLSGHHAQTAWNLSYKFTYEQVDGRFAATGFELKTKVTVTLPFWHTPKTVAPELRQQWLTYLRALYVHEQGHIDSARQAAAELARQLGGLGDFPSAQQLRHAITQTSTNLIARFRRQEADYDVKTQHGATQGAVFHVGPTTAPPR
jgi:predicted secreted Zn-dependent protease